MSRNDPLVQFREEQTTRTAVNDNKDSKIGTGKKPLEQIGLDRASRSPERTKIDLTLDIVMSLLRSEELEKLKNYITSYLTKRDGSEVK